MGTQARHGERQEKVLPLGPDQLHTHFHQISIACTIAAPRPPHALSPPITLVAYFFSNIFSLRRIPSAEFPAIGHLGKVNYTLEEKQNTLLYGLILPTTARGFATIHTRTTRHSRADSAPTGIESVAIVTTWSHRRPSRYPPFFFTHHHAGLAPNSY